ncbi:MAG: glutamine--fructose-6-phosphate transaminase (isomerizing) [Candidatus Competibacteraceae bacterium]|nr:glutamine--fructose-6-phosphate transaminase (isomerizing) [Candidatus Competibacteraceae bacterium]
MCGIVGAVAERNVTPILLEGLRRLEYRGYDSAGLALLTTDDQLQRIRSVGKVQALAAEVAQRPVRGGLGIAHTRWATHGAPNERNAHPHFSQDSIALVHNGIIENYLALRAELQAQGYTFDSDTDTEVVAHLVHFHMAREGDLLAAVQHTVAQLSGAYSLAVISAAEPGRLIGARQGSPLVVGIGLEEHFLASDTYALLPVTQRFVVLEEGDMVDLRRTTYTLYDRQGQPVERPLLQSQQSHDATDKGQYRHYMLKEIFEQSQAISDTLAGRIHNSHVLDSSFGPQAQDLFAQTRDVLIVACGTSYHAGLVARHWLESLGVPCQVEIASEYRYRDTVTRPGTLFVGISQSGETADTLAALGEAKRRGCIGSLAICNVAESSLVRESDVTLMTRAGREIGVASTKAFTTQLVVLRLLSLALARQHGLSDTQEAQLVDELQQLPRKLEDALALNDAIEKLAERFLDKQHALFLGRGGQYPIALEGALKLKEISYIHAEAYPAGELKHGPLALVDEDMPVICVLPNNSLMEKLLSNLQEVRARGGELFLFADGSVQAPEHAHTLILDGVPDSIAPIVFTAPLQLLAYHVAVLKGTDVDQPRNLAKSVTVE